MSTLILFSVVAVALVGAAFAFLLPTLLRGRARRDAPSQATFDAEVYRRSLEELDQEVAHGDLPPEALQAARDELRRRLIEDAAAPPAASRPGRARIAALTVAVALPAAAIALYLLVGMPSALQEAEAPPPAEEGADYIDRLQTHLARQPRDARGWVLLARAQAERNDYRSAALSYEKAFAVPRNKVDKDPSVLTEYADVLGMAQGGSLAGRPSELIRQALTIDPGHPVALEMAGSAAYADGRYADAVRHWKDLLARLEPGSERHQQLAAAVARAERRAAVALPR